MDSPEDKAPANPARGEGAPAPDLDSRTRRALRLFMEDPAGLPAFRSVEELLKSAQAWDTLASVYDQRFGAIANPAERAALLTRKGHLLESYLSRGEEAVQCYRQALDAHPADLDAHRRLAWTFERAKRWPDLAARLEKAAEHLKNRDDRVAALLLLAEIRVAHLDRADEAVDCFEQALALDPDRNDVFDGLCTLLMEMSRNEALAAALQTRAEYEEDGRALLRRAAVLYAGPLADTPGILDRAIACQERLVALEDAHGEGTANHSYLADLYRRAERWEPLVALLEADAARGGDAAEPLRDAAEILDSRIGDPARALTIWRTLLERGNDDGEALTACERLARASGDSETLAEILGIRNRAGHFENDAVAISANEERAHILLAMGGHDEEAARALEAVLSRDPGREEALAQLCELYDRLDRPVDRARKMARLADALPAATPPGKRGEAWREAAQALEAVGESEQATGAYEKAGDLLPEDIFVLTRLQALYDARGETDRACAAAKAELALLCDGKPEQPGQDPEREGILLDRLARAAAEEGRAEQALAHWQALLERAPAHREALRALAELFEKNGDSEGLLSVLTQLSQIEEAPGPRVALHLRVGRIYETACEEPEEAVTCYEQALAIDPHHEAALEALTGLLPSLGRWEAQATLLSRRASIAEGEARGALELERARILRDHLSDEEGAMRAFENALAVAPGCVEAMRDLADLHRAAGRWADVEALLARELEVEGDAERRIEIAEARAELWEGPLADPEKAAAIWEDLLETAPDHDVARERLMAWHRSAGRWADVARILETEISQGPSSDRERALHAELAQLCEEKLAATDRALAHYRAAACLDPGDSAMQAGLHRCLARSEAWEEVAGLLWFEAEAKREARPHAWADALVEIARIHEEALDDCAGAERILRDVLIAVPDHESAQSRLFGRLEARGDLEGLASLIATSLRTCENAAREVTLAREALRVAVAREAAGTGDADETVRACRRIITLGAEDDDVLRILALRLEEAGRHKQLLDALSMRLAVAENREVRLDVSLRLAALWEEHFHRPDRALAIYRQARQIDATCLPALRAMVRLCEEEGRSEELLGVCEALAKEEPDPMARAAILYRLATIYHAHFERDHDAIGNLERCLGLDPSHEDARDMLEHLTRKHQRYRTLARILEDRIALATAGNSAIGLSEFEEELGDVLTDHLGELKEAALAYSRAFEGAENDASRRRVGLKREAVLTQLDAADALREFYPVLLETMGEPEAVSRRAEAAGVWARYGDLLARHAATIPLERKAAEAYARAAALDPAGAIRFEERRKLLARIADHEGLASLLEEGAAREETDAGRAALLAASGDAWTEAGRAAEAEKAYRSALARDRKSGAAWAGLDRLLTDQNRRTDLAALREEQIAVATSAEETRALLLQAAEILKDLPGRSAQALSHYRRALALGPADGELLRAVADLSLLAGDESGAVMALERYLEVPPPRNDLVWTLSTLARLWEESLGRTGRAAAYCRMWLEADPGSDEARDRLERLAEQRREWRTLAELLGERCSGRSPDVTARLRRLARIYEEHLADPDRALEAWCRVLAVEPDAPDALATVADRAAGLGRWREGASALQRLIARTIDPEKRRGLRLRLAALLGEHPSEVSVAIDHLYAVLEEDPSEDEAARARVLLRVLLEREGRDEEIFDLLTESLADAPEEARTSIFAALGEIAEERLWRAPEAAKAYEAWLEREPGNLACIHRLQGLYRRLERWADLRALLARERDMAIADERRLSISLALAALEEEHLGSPRRAAAELESALPLSQKQAGVIASLARIYRELGDHEALHRTLCRERDLPERSDRAGAIHLEIARLEAGPLARLESAIESYGRAIDTADAPAAVLDGLARLQEKLGRHEDLIGTLRRLAEHVEGKEAQSELQVRMGEACARAGDVAQAIACHERAAEIVPGQPETLAALHRLYAQDENWEGVARALELRVACATEPAQAAALATDLGEIFADRLGNAEAAEAWYERAIALDEGCRSAYARLGTRRFDESDFESARTLLARARALQATSAPREESARLSLRLGLAAARTGDADGAIPALRDAVRLVPELVEGWETLGQLYLEAGEWPSALEALTTVANTTGVASKKEEEALRGIAIAEKALGRFEAGLAAVEKALHAAPDRFDLRALRAETLAALDRAEEASRAWREAADAAPDPEGRAECLYQGALMREALSGGAKRAIGWLREALAENPEHTGALRRLADHGLASESWQDAKSWLETLCRLREDPRDHADLGRVLWEGFGEEQRALASLRAAMALPDAGLDAVNLAVTICAERENWPRLVAVVEEFLSEKELSPAHIPLLEQLADVTAEKLYETEKAARALRAVVELAPGDLDARRALAAILARNQETHAEAIGEYRRIIAASPLDAPAWRGLAELNWFAKRRAGCEIAAAVVRITGGAADAAWEGVSGERGTAVAIESAVALCAPGSAARSALGEPALLDPLKRALQNAWPRLVPAAQGSPASTAQWPGARASALEQALGFWGIPGTPVFMAGEDGAPLRVTGGPRVAIGVREESMRKLPESIWRFYCHRVAAQIALGHGPAAVLDAAALGALLDALRGAANGAANGERVGDVVNWRNRRKIKAALDQLGNPGPEDLAACIAGFSESADRAALIACGDPVAALAGTALLGMEAPGFDPDRDPMAPLLDRSPAARRLLVFAAGEPFLEAIAQAAP